VYGGNDIGLKLDFANNEFYLGVDPSAGDAWGIYTSRLITRLGDWGGGNYGTELNIDDDLQIINTRYGGNDIGLNLDFSSSKYELGQLTGGNQTKLTINDATQTIALTGSLQVTGSTYLRGLTSSSQTNVLTYDSSSGQVFFTASSAIGGGGGTPAPSDTFIQYNSGSTFGATGSFRFIYASQSLQQGDNVQAIGQYSFAQGGGPFSFLPTIASGSKSHAEGYRTLAQGDNSHAEGDTTTTVGFASHAEGQGTVTIGNYSHAEGANTQAIGDYSHAEGRFTIASGSHSHTEGVRTVASASYQHVQGIANIGSAVTGAFIVGNGTVDNGGILLTRSNLIFAAGNTVEITGSLLISGSTNATQISNGWVVLSQVSASLDFANDAAAAAGGVPLGGLYRNGNAISIRIV
jgi:hypothetical protein